MTARCIRFVCFAMSLVWVLLGPTSARATTTTPGSLASDEYDVSASARTVAQDFGTGSAEAVLALSTHPDDESDPVQSLAEGRFATNSARFGTHSADDLAASAAGAGKGDYSAAGHALTKHAGGQRAGTSAFPSLSGNPANINQVAQAQIDDILATGRVVTRTHPNHGPIIEVFAPDGRGARWYADGRFFGFLEP